MKFRKDPYCVDFHCEFTPHSTHFLVTPHSLSGNVVSDKAPIPHISITFSQYCRQTQAFCAGKPPIPHTFCAILIFTPISHSVLQVLPPFCVHTIPHHFSISDPPFHTQFCSSMLLHILGKPPPPGPPFYILLLLPSGDEVPRVKFTHCMEVSLNQIKKIISLVAKTLLMQLIPELKLHSQKR